MLINQFAINFDHEVAGLLLFCEIIFIVYFTKYLQNIINYLAKYFQ